MHEKRPVFAGILLASILIAWENQALGFPQISLGGGGRTESLPAEQNDDPIAKWRALAQQRRNLQATMGNLLLKPALADSTNEEERIQQILQVHQRLGEMKLEVLEAAANAFIQKPESEMAVVLLRDTAGYLRVLMGDDTQINRYDPKLAVETIEKILKTGWRDTSILRTAVQASVASEDFGAASKYLDMFAESGIDIAESRKQLQYIEEQWTREQEFRKRDEATELPLVRFEIQSGSDRGVIICELFEDDAPNTVASFVSLVQKGFYDNQGFFNVDPGNFASAGCPAENGLGNAGYLIPEEFELDTARRHFAGSLSTCHNPGQKSGSQYSFIYQPSPARDSEFTVFGRIVEGFDVLARLPHWSAVDRASGKSTSRVISVKMIRTRPHEYTPQQTFPVTNSYGADEQSTPTKDSETTMMEKAGAESSSQGGGGSGGNTLELTAEKLNGIGGSGNRTSGEGGGNGGKK